MINKTIGSGEREKTKYLEQVDSLSPKKIVFALGPIGGGSTVGNAGADDRSDLLSTKISLCHLLANLYEFTTALEN